MINLHVYDDANHLFATAFYIPGADSLRALRRLPGVGPAPEPAPLAVEERMAGALTRAKSWRRWLAAATRSGATPPRPPENRPTPKPLSTPATSSGYMDNGEERGFDEDGVYWDSTRAELEAWKKYKQLKAVAFVERGYSAAWYPDGDNWMEVYVPQRHHAKTPETRATVKFFGRPSQHGIDGGMVSKLSIDETWTDIVRWLLGRTHEKTRQLYNYDRGLEIDRLAESPTARDLYFAILEELN